mgnify:FL=1
MISGSSAFNDILEKKYKILRTSLILGNSKNRDDLLLQFEDTARRVDDIYNNRYLQILASKKYPTKNLNEEEDRLRDLIDFIKKRVYDRKCFLDDYKEITLYNLDGLKDISDEDELSLYENRLSIIDEYLANVDKIDDINKRISECKDELDEKYKVNAENQALNVKYEDTLLDEFNKIILDDEYYSKLSYTDIDKELEDLDISSKDKKATLDTFIASYDALENSGIGEDEKNEYKSYVRDAKVDYYSDVEKIYILKLYKMVLDKKTEYKDIFSKRENITNLLNERLVLRNDLDIDSFDVLSGFYDIVCDQFGVVKAQKYTIESIDNLILTLDGYENDLKELTMRNSDKEILDVVSDYIFDIDKKPTIEVEDTEEDVVEEEVPKIEDIKHLDNEVVAVEDAVDFDTDVVSMQAIDVMKRVVEALDIDKDNIITVENDKDDIFLDEEPKVEEKEDSKKNILTKEVPMTEEDIFKDIDPFLDDNMYENDNEKVKDDTMGLVMPDIDKIGSVKPTNTLSKIEDIAKDNNDLVLPTLGLINNTKDVSLVSDNYLS